MGGVLFCFSVLMICDMNFLSNICYLDNFFGWWVFSDLLPAFLIYLCIFFLLSAKYSLHISDNSLLSDKSANNFSLLDDTQVYGISFDLCKRHKFYVYVYVFVFDCLVVPPQLVQRLFSIIFPLFLGQRWMEGSDVIYSVLSVQLCWSIYLFLCQQPAALMTVTL